MAKSPTPNPVLIWAEIANAIVTLVIEVLKKREQGKG